MEVGLRLKDSTAGRTRRIYEPEPLSRGVGDCAVLVQTDRISDQTICRKVVLVGAVVFLYARQSPTCSAHIFGLVVRR